MAKIINKEYDDKLLNYTILDCRYPYEYEGGHINVSLSTQLLIRAIAHQTPALRVGICKFEKPTICY